MEGLDAKRDRLIQWSNTQWSAEIERVHGIQEHECFGHKYLQPQERFSDFQPYSKVMHQEKKELRLTGV